MAFPSTPREWETGISETTGEWLSIPVGTISIPGGGLVPPGDPWGEINGIYEFDGIGIPGDVQQAGVGSALAQLAKWGLAYLVTSEVAGSVIAFFRVGKGRAAVGFLKGLAGKRWLLLAAGLAAAGLISTAIYGWLKGEGRKAKGKRYSIGASPRIETLLRVAKRVDNIFLRFDKRVRKFRGRIRGAYRVGRAAHKVLYADGRAKRDLTIVR